MTSDANDGATLNARSRRPVKWKDDEDRGEFGAWLTAQVGDRTYDWLASEMAKKGHVHGADYYRAMAGGSKPPGRQIRRALEEFFGAPPRREVAAPGPSEIVDALHEQTEALRAQAEAIDKMTEAINVAALAVLTSQAELKGGQLELADLLGRLADGETLAELARSIRAVPAP